MQKGAFADFAAMRRKKGKTPILRQTHAKYIIIIIYFLRLIAPQKDMISNNIRAERSAAQRGVKR